MKNEYPKFFYFNRYTDDRFLTHNIIFRVDRDGVFLFNLDKGREWQKTSFSTEGDLRKWGDKTWDRTWDRKEISKEEVSLLL